MDHRDVFTFMTSVVAPRTPIGVARQIAICISAIGMNASAQVPVIAIPGEEVAARRPLPCDIAPQPPYQGRSVWNTNLWSPGGVVPYEFDRTTPHSLSGPQSGLPGTTAEDRSAMIWAMAELEATADVHFVPRDSTNEAHFPIYLHIQNSGTANNSQIGMVGPGQIVNIHDWNTPGYEYVPVHELMHALGFFHEQQRSDRDSFITVNKCNIQGVDCATGAAIPHNGSYGATYDNNFATVSGNASIEYDFDSVLHYGACEFSIDCPTGYQCDCTHFAIQALAANARYQGIIGQRNHLSVGDQQGLVSRYGAPIVNWTRRMVSGPSARFGAAMAYDISRGVTVLFGGTTSQANYNGETWEWNGSDWTQREVSGPSPRDGNGMMAYDSARHVTVLFGGFTAIGYSGETWEWDGAAWNQRFVSGPPPRAYHSMAFDTSRSVVVLFGGEANVPGGLAGDTWEWNGFSWAQRATSGPPPRYNHAMGYDMIRGEAVLFGGGIDAASRMGDTWGWNGTVWSQRSSSGPSARVGSAIAYDSARGISVLFGGYTGATYSGETWEWNGATWSQRATSGPSGRFAAATAYDAARHVTVLFGGYNGGANGETWELSGPCITPSITTQPTAPPPICAGSPAHFTVNTAGTGPRNYQWRHGVPRVGIPGATLATYALASATSTDAGEYDCVISNACGSVTSNPVTLTVSSNQVWTPQRVSGPPPRSGTAMAYDAARRKTILFGGYNSSLGTSGQTWAWNGSIWTQVAVTGPTPRSSHAMAYDSARNVTVLFGGNNNGETWEWNGSAWAQKVVSGPSPRSRHAMAYDSDRGVTVLFGGVTNSGYSGETWEWNGTVWAQRLVTGPPARYAHAMAYDATRRVTVLFGGSNGSVNNSETWEWNGTAWAQRIGTGPPARYYHAMAYDTSCGVTVLYGGANVNGTYYGDTWAWNGSMWVQLAINGPSPRADDAMAYDSARDVTVLFGGYNPSVSYNGESWELGPNTAGPNTIAFARAASLGTVLTLRNVHISCPVDTVTSTSVASCTIEDVTGAITVFGDNQMIQTVLNAATGSSGTGNVIDSMTGTTNDFNGLLEFVNVVSPVVSGGRYEAPTLTTVSAADIAVFSPIGETLESKLVLIPNFVFSQSGPFVSGTDYNNGGIDARVATTSIANLFNATVGGIPTGRRVWMIGVLSQFIGYRFMPVSIGLCASISGQPMDQTACGGSSVSFSITAAGTGPFTYQWRKHSLPIDTNVNPSSVTASLMLANVQIPDVDIYDCVVSNNCGSIVSNPAQLTICIGDSNCDGGIDGTDVGAFFADWESGSTTADVNYDGGIDGSDVSTFFEHWEAGC